MGITYSKRLLAAIKGPRSQHEPQQVEIYHHVSLCQLHDGSMPLLLLI